MGFSTQSWGMTLTTGICLHLMIGKPSQNGGRRIRWIRIMSRILAISIASLLSSCAPHGSGTYFTSGVRDYTGDGTIQDTSQRGGFFPTRCYMVTLPSFPLNRPYEHTFRLDGLPTIEGKPTEIAFFVPNSFSQSHTPNAHSRVEFSVTTADSRRVRALVAL
ncbi:MAG: hypothetical protein QOD99_2387 [Chthoniobacter sp.]|nr:hypothetical protein [Chthoniobacter sp.]